MMGIKRILFPELLRATTKRKRKELGRGGDCLASTLAPCENKKSRPRRGKRQRDDNLRRRRDNACVSVLVDVSNIQKQTRTNSHEPCISKRRLQFDSLGGLSTFVPSKKPQSATKKRIRIDKTRLDTLTGISDSTASASAPSATKHKPKSGKGLVQSRASVLKGGRISKHSANYLRGLKKRSASTDKTLRSEPNSKPTSVRIDSLQLSKESLREGEQRTCNNENVNRALQSEAPLQSEKKSYQNGGTLKERDVVATKLQSASEMVLGEGMSLEPASAAVGTPGCGEKTSRRTEQGAFNEDSETNSEQRIEIASKVKHVASTGLCSMFGLESTVRVSSRDAVSYTGRKQKMKRRDADKQVIQSRVASVPCSDVLGSDSHIISFDKDIPADVPSLKGSSPGSPREVRETKCEAIHDQDLQQAGQQRAKSEHGPATVNKALVSHGEGAEEWVNGRTVRSKKYTSQTNSGDGTEKRVDGRTTRSKKCTSQTNIELLPAKLCHGTVINTLEAGAEGAIERRIIRPKESESQPDIQISIKGCHDHANYSVKPRTERVEASGEKPSTQSSQSALLSTTAVLDLETPRAPGRLSPDEPLFSKTPTFNRIVRVPIHVGVTKRGGPGCYVMEVDSAEPITRIRRSNRRSVQPDRLSMSPACKRKRSTESIREARSKDLRFETKYKKVRRTSGNRANQSSKANSRPPLVIRTADKNPEAKTEAKTRDGEEEWTNAELSLLRRAHKEIDPKSVCFWEEVADVVRGKSALQCREKWFSSVKTPKVREKRRPLHSAPKCTSVPNHDDDIFDATPMKALFATSGTDETFGLFGQINDLPDFDFGSAIKVTRESIGTAPQRQPRNGYKTYIKTMKRAVNNGPKARKQKKSKVSNHNNRKNLLANAGEGDIQLSGRMSPGGTLHVSSKCDNVDEAQCLEYSDWEAN